MNGLVIMGSYLVWSDEVSSDCPVVITAKNEIKTSSGRWVVVNYPEIEKEVDDAEVQT